MIYLKTQGVKTPLSANYFILEKPPIRHIILFSSFKIGTSSTGFKKLLMDYIYVAYMYIIVYRYGIAVLLSKDVPDTEFTGYPACRISGNSKSRIPDLRLN